MPDMLPFLSREVVVPIPYMSLSAGSGSASLSITLFKPFDLVLERGHVTLVHDAAGIAGERLLARVYSHFASENAGGTGSVRWVTVRPPLAHVLRPETRKKVRRRRWRRSVQVRRRVSEPGFVDKDYGLGADILLVSESDHPESLSQEVAESIFAKALTRGDAILSVTRSEPVRLEGAGRLLPEWCTFMCYTCGELRQLVPY